MSVNGDDSSNSTIGSSPDLNLYQSSEELHWADAINVFSSTTNHDEDTVAVKTLDDDNVATTIPLPMRSYCKWSPTQQGATLVWRDVCVYATDAEQPKGHSNRGQLKRIINNSTGAIQPGTLMALMGSR